MWADDSSPRRAGHAGDAAGGRYNFSFDAGVAQLVEQRIRNAKVEGSTPSTGTIKTKA
jgi:hypothetical protein